VNLPFADRQAAGKALGEVLASLGLPGRLVVVALPRGGVPVAVAVAGRLDAPLDLMPVRKIGWPGDPECAMGAVAPGGTVYRDPRSLQAGLSEAQYEGQLAVARSQLQQREDGLRQQLPPLPLRGATVILVDDGAATGATLQAALLRLRQLAVQAVVVALPVAPAETVQALRAVADGVVVLAQPEPFHAVGQHFHDFHAVGETELAQCIDWVRDARQRRRA
jgi:putative phosphoribosyl transferase